MAQTPTGGTDGKEGVCFRKWLIDSALDEQGYRSFQPREFSFLYYGLTMAGE